MLQWTWGCIYPFKLVFSFPSDKYPQVKLLGHVIVLCLIFLKPSILFSIVLCQFTFLAVVHRGFLLHTLVSAFIPWLLMISHPQQCQETPNCGSDWRLSVDRWQWAYFHVPVCCLYVFFGNVSIQVFCSLYKWSFLLFWILILWAVYIF